MVMEKKDSPISDNNNNNDNDTENDGGSSSDQSRSSQDKQPRSSIHDLRARFLRSQSPSPRAVLRPNRKKLAVEEPVVVPVVVEEVGGVNDKTSAGGEVKGEGLVNEKKKVISGVGGKVATAGANKIKSDNDDDAKEEEDRHAHDEAEDVVYGDPIDDVFNVEHENAFVGGGSDMLLRSTNHNRSGSRKRSIASKMHHSYSFNEQAITSRHNKLEDVEDDGNDDELNSSNSISSNGGRSEGLAPNNSCYRSNGSPAKRTPAPLMRSASMSTAKPFQDDPHTVRRQTNTLTISLLKHH
jgi:hypothetical protein